MSIEKINFKEKEIAAMYSIPLKTLRKCRKQQEFGTDVCFTAPNSHIVLYNKEKFEKWFEANKSLGISRRVKGRTNDGRQMECKRL